MNIRLLGFLRLFLPVAALIVLGTYLLVDAQRQSRLAEVRANESLNIGLGAAMLDRRTEIVLRDLQYLASHNFAQAWSDNPQQINLRHMTEDFVDYLRVKPVFDQIRWIDARGEEIVRVDLKDGKPLVVPREKLQNKADRYYFSETMRLEPGQVYISPMDLNVEHGAIELPHKPMLRLATPVADSQGKKQGILILNYLSDEMIAYLEAVTQNAADRITLVNNEGYYLHAPDPADQWGFMFNDPQRSLASRFPSSWATISAAAHGQFVDEHGMWSFQAVYPQQTDSHNADEIRRLAGKNHSAAETTYRWTVVSHLNPEQLAQRLQRDEGKTYAFTLLLLALFAAGVYALLRAAGRKKVTEEQFKVYFERATVGMAMTSIDKRWLAVNPALCQILGYPAAALLNKTWNEVTFSEDVSSDDAQREQVLCGEREGYEVEKRLVRADGALVHTFVSTQVIRHRNGSPDYFLVIVEDISQRVVAQKQKQKSLETLRRFIDNLPGLAYIKDSESRILVANRQLREMIGLPAEALIGQPTDTIFPGRFGQKLIADDQRILASGHAELIQETINGRFYETIKFPIPHDDGPAELGGVTMDITERKQAEQMLQLQARRATALLQLPQKSVLLDESAFLAFALQQVSELTASPFSSMHAVSGNEENVTVLAALDQFAQDAISASCGRVLSIAQAGLWGDAIRLKQAVLVNIETTPDLTCGLPNGDATRLRLMTVPVVDEDQVRMTLSVGDKTTPYSDTDLETLQLLGNEIWRIMRQQRAESALRIANQVVNASPVICFRWAATDGWPVVFVSENITRWGYTPNELQAGKPPFAELIHPDDLARVVQEVSTQTANGLDGYEQEYRIVTRENQAIWVVDRTIVRRDATGKVLFYDGVLTDISEGKKQQLTLANNLSQQQELNKRLEEAHNQLLQSEKMASIGQLAAGIAHELNNPIGFVHSNLGTLDGYIRDLMDIIKAYDELASSEAAASPLFGKIKSMKEDRDFKYISEDIVQLLIESKDGLARVRKIVQDLKSFSHVSEQEWQWADLHQGLDSTLNIVWNELKYKCQVVREFGDLPKVFCMISQLNQVFMNLLVNAGHAIETKGTITLRTWRIGSDAVCIEIGDTGKGIAPEHIKRIFEPFFTTKPIGKGTGLGLSLSYGIVDKHHGRIEVDSTPGQGSRFRVIVPIKQDNGAADQPNEEA